jgi:hypothetical protein
MKTSILMIAALATACGGGIAHTKVVDAKVLATVAGLEKLGTLTSVRSIDGAIYVAGESGAAAVDAQGKTLWTLELPYATERLIEADARGVAFTSFDLGNVDRAEGLKSFIMGNAGDIPEYTNQTVAYASPAGRLLWTTRCAAAKAALSAPAFSPDQIAVSRGGTLTVYSRADGRQAWDSDLATDNTAGTSMVLLASYNRPVFTNGFWYAAHLNYLAKYDVSGKVLNTSRTFGLFTPFMNITGGLLASGEGVVFGNAPWNGKRALLLAADKDGEKNWKEEVDDKHSGVSSLAINKGGTIFAATNFVVTAFSPSGSKQWQADNGKGGLYPGSQRGVRYIGNAWAKDFAVRKSPAEQMVADERFVYITSRHDKNDVLTVLDAKSGAYFDSVTIGAEINDMTITPGALALATGDGLKLIALQ